MDDRAAPHWALILAGGEGTRLRPLTHRISGDARPKQFCTVLDGETLLDRTRRRADRLVRGDRQLVVVTRSHEAYYQPLLRDLAPGRLVVQPGNRGTAPAIVYSMLRILALAGDVPVVVMPSDHWVDDDAAFMAFVEAAVDVARAEPARVTLLGIEPTWPEPEYGWIEPASMPLPLGPGPAFAIRRFVEKPDVATARSLYYRGCLWNSFVMVGWAGALLGLVSETRPALFGAFAPLHTPAHGRRSEEAIVADIYRSLPRSTGFSEAVLAEATSRLAVVKVKGVEWNDWGTPRRVLLSLRRAGLRPAWLDHVTLAEAG